MATGGDLISTLGESFSVVVLDKYLTFMMNIMNSGAEAVMTLGAMDKTQPDWQEQFLEIMK